MCVGVFMIYLHTRFGMPDSWFISYRQQTESERKYFKERNVLFYILQKYYIYNLVYFSIARHKYLGPQRLCGIMIY
jgi:hypothetical protein